MSLLEDKRLSCGEVMRVLQAFLDGELGADRAEQVAVHLESYCRCGVEAAILRDVIEQIRSLRPDLDLAANTRLERSLDDHPPRRVRLASGPREPQPTSWPGRTPRWTYDDRAGVARWRGQLSRRCLSSASAVSNIESIASAVPAGSTSVRQTSRLASPSSWTSTRAWWDSTGIGASVMAYS